MPLSNHWPFRVMHSGEILRCGSTTIGSTTSATWPSTAASWPDSESICWTLCPALTVLLVVRRFKVEPDLTNNGPSSLEGILKLTK